MHMRYANPLSSCAFPDYFCQWLYLQDWDSPHGCGSNWGSNGGSKGVRTLVDMRLLRHCACPREKPQILIHEVSLIIVVLISGVESEGLELFARV